METGCFTGVTPSAVLKRQTRYALLVLGTGIVPPMDKYASLLSLKCDTVALFLGEVSLKDESRICLVREHAEFGNAHHLFDTCDQDGMDVSMAHRLLMAEQVTAGLEALHKASVIHGDVAAANVLVFDFDPDRAEQTRVKLTGQCLVGPADRHADAARAGARKAVRHMPWAPKWAALETLKKGKFTQNSDIWGLGVCLWEILTKCEVRPYLEVEKDDSSAMVKHLSQDGHRLSKPPESSEAIYGVLTHCWSQFGKNRPSLEAIQTALKEEMARQASL